MNITFNNLSVGDKFKHPQSKVTYQKTSTKQCLPIKDSKGVDIQNPIATIAFYNSKTLFIKV